MKNDRTVPLDLARSDAVILWLSMVIMQLQVFDFTPFASRIIQEFAITYTQLGLIQTALFLPYTLLQLLAGAIMGRYQTKKMLMISASTFSLSSILIAFTQSFYQMVALRAVMGASLAFIFVLSSKLILGSGARKGRGLSFGAYASSFALGPLMAAVAPSAFGSFIENWRAVILVLGLFGLVSILLILFLATPATESKRTTLNLTPILKRKETWVLEYDQFLRFGTAAAISTWIPTYAGQLFHLSTTESGLMLASIWVLTLVFTPVGGLLSDVQGRNFVVIEFALLGLIPSLFALGIASSFYTLLIPALVVGALMNSHVAPLFKLLPELYGDETIVPLIGLSGAAASAGAMALPPLLGLVRDATGEFALGWFMLAALTLVAAVVTTSLKRF